MSSELWSRLLCSNAIDVDISLGTGVSIDISRNNVSKWSYYMCGSVSVRMIVGVSSDVKLKYVK
jgi:hypothetical protein